MLLVTYDYEQYLFIHQFWVMEVVNTYICINFCKLEH